MSATFALIKFKNGSSFTIIKERLKASYVDGFQNGDYIVIQEKIDGANFSIKYDAESDTVVSFSRKKILDFENNLRGAWQWCQKLNKELIKNVLGKNLILFHNSILLLFKFYLSQFFLMKSLIYFSP